GGKRSHADRVRLAPQNGLTPVDSAITRWISVPAKLYLSRRCTLVEKDVHKDALTDRDRLAEIVDADRVRSCTVVVHHYRLRAASRLAYIPIPTAGYCGTPRQGVIDPYRVAVWDCRFSRATWNAMSHREHSRTTRS